MRVFATPFGNVKITSGEVSPLRDDGLFMIGETHLADFFQELWVNGFKLTEIVVEKETFCPTCKRPL